MRVLLDEQQATIPAGTCAGDPVHSSIGFAVKYLGVATFAGAIGRFQASLTSLRAAAELLPPTDAVVGSSIGMRARLGDAVAALRAEVDADVLVAA